MRKFRDLVKQMSEMTVSRYTRTDRQLSLIEI